MKRAQVVIGSAWGDEGKGLMTDYFCRQNKGTGIVVRFNGGAQAGHTVVTPDGKRHVFHHFGSGTYAGASTFLSKDFLVNPFAWEQEYKELGPDASNIYIDPAALITTVYDMFLNQEIEKARTKRHGSCGMGVHETMVRAEKGISLFASDLYQPDIFKFKYGKVRNYVAKMLTQLGFDSIEAITWLWNEQIYKKSLATCFQFADRVSLAGPSFIAKRFDYVVFEGAQGLLLDAENKQFFPHVTHSRTGLTNVIPLAKQMGIAELDVTYVARSYLTRHGAGPLPGEDPNMKFEDNTNVQNDWQHSLRFAPQDPDLIRFAVAKDIVASAGKGVRIDSNFAITHCDQHNDHFPSKMNIAYRSYGPTWQDVIETNKKAAHAASSLMQEDSVLLN